MFDEADHILNAPFKQTVFTSNRTQNTKGSNKEKEGCKRPYLWKKNHKIKSHERIRFQNELVLTHKIIYIQIDLEVLTQ